MQARKRIHHEDPTSVGNGLQNRTWSHGNDSEEEEIASENTLLNEVGQRYDASTLIKIISQSKIIIIKFANYRQYY